ncbi:MAG: hypothetical protein IS860_01460 [Nitrosopumilus sp.]|nr:hypothetical protein [Nitrosopumilus sp.]
MKNEIDVEFDLDEQFTLWEMRELIEKNYNIYATEEGIKVPIQGIV